MLYSVWVFIMAGLFTALFIGWTLKVVCMSDFGKTKPNRRRRPNPDGEIQMTNQDDDIWNISSRVNQQGQRPVQSPPGTWPTHDHRLSVSDFVLVPEYTHKQNKPPPPPYAEVDLPSYEQATGCPAPRADLPPVHQNRDAGSSH